MIVIAFGAIGVAPIANWVPGVGPVVTVLFIGACRHAGCSGVLDIKIITWVTSRASISTGIYGTFRTLEMTRQTIIRSRF